MLALTDALDSVAAKPALAELRYVGAQIEKAAARPLSAKADDYARRRHALALRAAAAL